MTKEFPMTNAEFSLITRASGGESRGLPSRRQRDFHELATLCWERIGHWDIGHSLVIAALVISHLLRTRTHWKCRGTQFDLRRPSPCSVCYKRPRTFPPAAPKRLT